MTPLFPSDGTEASLATLVSDTNSSDSEDLDADEAALEQVCAVRPVACPTSAIPTTRSSGENGEAEQRSSGEAEQTKQTATQATPPDEEDAEEVPQWIWDELTELKQVYADVVGMELPKETGMMVVANEVCQEIRDGIEEKLWRQYRGVPMTVHPSSPSVVVLVIKGDAGDGCRCMSPAASRLRQCFSTQSGVSEWLWRIIEARAAE
ncbi:hypothetical protein CYMTET_12174, partial [Cymbomonas tetramitiformis]